MLVGDVALQLGEARADGADRVVRTGELREYLIDLGATGAVAPCRFGAHRPQIGLEDGDVGLGRETAGENERRERRVGGCAHHDLGRTRAPPPLGWNSARRFCS